MSPRPAAEPGSGLLKGPGCFSRALWEFERKDCPQRVLGQVRGAHGLELILMGEGILSTGLKLAHSLRVSVKCRIRCIRSGA